MEINWWFEISGILTALVIFPIIKNSKSKISEKEIQIFNKIPRQYFFFIFAAAFFGVSIVVDLIGLFTDSFGLCIFWKYFLPLSPSLATYLKLKQASKDIESKEGKALAS